MANRGAVVEPLVSGAALKGAAKTATFTTDGFSFNQNGSRISLFCATTTTGTSPTLDITPEVSFDAGTSYVSMQNTFDSTTAAALTQITASGQDYEWWYNGIPFGDDTSTYKMRLVCTIGGTNPSVTFDQIKVACWTEE
jgi:hypothetical protein